MTDIDGVEEPQFERWDWRLFHLTIGVYLGPNEAIPNTFRDWIERANICSGGASTTYLDSVTELRYPLADDIVAKRRGRPMVKY